MYTNEADCSFTHNIGGVDFFPQSGELLQPLKCGIHSPRVERTIAFLSGQSGNAFDFRAPPNEHIGIARKQCTQLPTRFLMDE